MEVCDEDSLDLSCRPVKIVASRRGQGDKLDKDHKEEQHQFIGKGPKVNITDLSRSDTHSFLSSL